jgi:hypothetical protein
VLEREGLLRDYKWCTTEVEFSRSILVWYLATDICYRADKDGSNASTGYEASRWLSEYMMYLLVMRPNMLSKGIGDEGLLIFNPPYLIFSKKLKCLTCIS